MNVRQLDQKCKFLTDSEKSSDFFTQVDCRRYIIEVMSFKRPITVRAYGLKSADKSPNESPKAWKFEGFVPNTTKGEFEYKIIHDMLPQ